MKIYLVRGPDSDDGERYIKKVAEKAFNSNRKALDYVIEQYYSGDFYKEMIPEWKDSNASVYVQELTVE